MPDPNESSPPAPPPPDGGSPEPAAGANAQPEGSEASGGGPVPGTMTTYGKRESLEHIRRMGHRADVAPSPPPGDPAGPPVRELPGSYLTPDGYGVVQDMLETYQLYKSGHPRACVERLLDRLQTGAKAFENQPLAENPLGDAPFEG